jgi:predicted RNA-binding Zn ribbon-like protein
VIPQLLIALDSLGRPRKPTGATHRVSEPVLPDAATATRQLQPFLDSTLTEADLPALRDLQRVAVRTAEAVLANELPDCAAINNLARASIARSDLVVAGGAMVQRLVWTDATPASALARQLISELTGLDPSRMRRCARAECPLLFYDTTRSRTRRWHAEDPCGWRERQQQRRHRIS